MKSIEGRRTHPFYSVKLSGKGGKPTYLYSIRPSRSSGRSHSFALDIGEYKGRKIAPFTRLGFTWRTAWMLKETASNGKPLVVPVMTETG